MAKCGKQCYPTKESARRAMRRVPPLPSGRMPLRIYWCGKCKAYHFTSRPGHM
jgi:hypothetical protein